MDPSVEPGREPRWWLQGAPPDPSTAPLQGDALRGSGMLEVSRAPAPDAALDDALAAARALGVSNDVARKAPAAEHLETDTDPLESLVPRYSVWGR